MHLGILASYWWLVLSLMLLVMVVFVLVAGRHAAGGFGARARQGWQRWQAVSKKAADVQARIILTLFYFTLAMPFGLARTYLSDPLNMKKRTGPRSWHVRQTRDLTLDDARKQY